MDVVGFFWIALVILAVICFVIVSRIKPEKRRREREYGVKSVTAKGEGVKSIAERRIADYFGKKNIKYVYEQVLKHEPLFVSYRISVPDFYLPDYDVYVEYLGLVDADDKRKKEQYVRSMKRKMAIYYRNHIKFISLYPYDMENLDWVFRRNFKKATGVELPS